MGQLITAVKLFKDFVEIGIAGGGARGGGGKNGDQCLILICMLPILHNIKIRAIPVYLPEIRKHRSKPDAPLN